MNGGSVEQTKEEYITLLNVVSAISVVCLHVNGCFWTFSTDRYWFRANIIESVFYFAVPIFFMISGATLVNYGERYSTKEYAIKRIKKVCIPFIAWSLIGLCFNIRMARVDVAAINLKYLVNGILGTSINGTYWFFPSIICVYLCIPLLAATSKEKRKEIFSYLAVASFLINCLIPFYISIFEIDMRWPLSISVGSGYLLYVIVGYLLNECELTGCWKIIVYICALAGLLVHMVGTYALSMAEGSIVSTYKGYLNVPCILYSVGIFLFFKDWGFIVMNSIAGRLVNFLRDYTLGIYLVHIYVRNVMSAVFQKYLSVSSTSFIYLLMGVPICVVISAAIVAALRKMPVIKHIVP